MSTAMRKVALAAVLALLGAGLSSIIGRACGVGTELGLNSAAGPPGSEVAATGTGFADGPVSIRWETPTGTTLATTTGPYFKDVGFSIPASATPGLHYVDAWDGVGAQYWTTTFTVTAPASADSTGAAAPAPPAPGSATTTPSTNAVSPGVTTSGVPPVVAAGAAPLRASNGRGVSPGDPTIGQSPGDAAPADVGTSAGSAPSAASGAVVGQSAKSLFENPGAAFSREGAPGPLALVGAVPQQPGLSPGVIVLAACLPLLLGGAAVLAAKRHRVRVR